VSRIKISDGSSWPRPDIEADEGCGLAWRLTYTTPTRQELLAAASVISAYEHLVLGSNRAKRDLVCRDIRAALRDEGGVR